MRGNSFPIDREDQDNIKSIDELKNMTQRKKKIKKIVIELTDPV